MTPLSSKLVCNNCSCDKGPSSWWGLNLSMTLLPCGSNVKPNARRYITNLTKKKVTTNEFWGPGHSKKGFSTLPMGGFRNYKSLCDSLFRENCSSAGITHKHLLNWFESCETVKDRQLIFYKATLKGPTSRRFCCCCLDVPLAVGVKERLK